MFPKIRVSEEVFGGVSQGPFGLGPRVSKRCPESVFGVSKGVRTLRRHSRDTFWTLWGPGPREPPRHSPEHFLGHPDFGEHSLGHSGDTPGPKGPKPPVGGWGCLNDRVSEIPEGPSACHERMWRDCIFLPFARLP